MKLANALLGMILLMANMACSQKTAMREDLETVVLGGGCFWCTEAVFQQLKGIEEIEAGYAGGHQVNPTYEQVCSGITGHVEVIKLWYDPKVVTYPEILEVFFKTHDPTTLNRQGNDVGEQYRSVIFYEDNKEKQVSEEIIRELDDSGYYPQKIVTAVEPLSNYYPAENYHQEYYKYNKDKNPYCTYVITPKVEKFEKIFKDKMKQ